MRFTRRTIGFSLALLAFAALADGQDTQRPTRRPARMTHLVPEGLEGKLNLSSEQKTKVANLEKEFTEKFKDAESKLREATEKARETKDRAALRQAREKLDDPAKLREAYQRKVADLLTADQKKVFEQADSARLTAGRPTARTPAGAASVLLPALQERLGLSAEQREKLSQLQKDFDAKALEILSPEQRQRLEQLRKGRPRQQ